MRDVRGRLSTLWDQARDAGLDVYVVARPAWRDAAQRLSAAATQSSAHVLLDLTGRLMGTYAAGSAQAVLVHADGVVGAVLADLPTDGSAGARYAPLLAQLRSSGAPPSLQAAPGAH